MPNGHKHARPPLRVVETTIEEQPRRRGRRRVLLPEDDPFVLLGMVDETGGITGEGKPMRPAAAAAFRAYCMMSPMHRSLARLAATLDKEWGKAPNRKTIESWSSAHGWQKLVKLYDEQLDRYRLLKLEQDRLAARDRHARVGRALVTMASNALRDDITGFDADGQPIPTVDPATGRRKPNRVQALAMTVKIGIDAERQALGLPTIISDQNVRSDVNQVSTNVHMTLEEWRSQTRMERIREEDDTTPIASLGPSPDEGQRALPAPRTSGRAQNDVGRLSEEQRNDLPASWFDTSPDDAGDAQGDIVEGKIVDATVDS
jgi:hypothetical protein